MRLKIRQNMRYAHVEGIYRTMYPNVYVDPYNPNNPNFPFLDPAGAPWSAIIWSRETSQGQLYLGQQCRAEIAHRAGCAQALVGVDYRVPQGTRAIRLRHDPTPFDLYAPVYTGVTPPALSPEPDLRQSQLGLYVQDQMRLGPWLAVVGLRQDYVTSNVAGIAGRKTPRRPPAVPG